MERVLRLLLSAAQRSKWGVLFVVAGAFGVLALLLFGFVSIVGNIILMVAGVEPAIEFLGSGWGIIAVAIISIFFMFVGVGILWFLRPHTPHPTPDTEKSSSPSPPSTDSEEIEQLKYQNQQLRKQVEKATAQLSLPANVAVERRIANRDFRIHDLLKLEGTNSTIEGKEFENCTIRGPATITTAAPPRPPEKRRGAMAQGEVWHLPTLYVEGDPNEVLQEVPSGGATASGVIHLVGCSYKRVTFSGIAIAGNADELKWWRENATFSRASTAPKPSVADTNSHQIPEHMISERHIRYHETPIRLSHLLEVAGEDGVLRDFQFEHCTLEGPGIINLEGPFPKPATTGQGSTSSLSVGPTNCRVEGSPEATLYQIARGEKMPVGVIHLAGYTLRAVTFRNVGFVGTPEHLEWLKEHLVFSEGWSGG